MSRASSLGFGGFVSEMRRSVSTAANRRKKTSKPPLSTARDLPLWSYTDALVDWFCFDLIKFLSAPFYFFKTSFMVIEVEERRSVQVFGGY